MVSTPIALPVFACLRVHGPTQGLSDGKGHWRNQDSFPWQVQGAMVRSSLDHWLGPVTWRPLDRSIDRSRGCNPLPWTRGQNRVLCLLCFMLAWDHQSNRLCDPLKRVSECTLTKGERGRIASFAFGYCVGLFWACLTNRVLLVLSGSYLWLCDHKGPVDLTNVITKGNRRACQRPRRPVVFSCVYKAFVHGTLEKTGKWFVSALLPPILTT